MEKCTISVDYNTFKTITDVLVQDIRTVFSSIRRENISELEHVEILTRRLLDRFVIIYYGNSDIFLPFGNVTHYLEIISLVVFWIVTKLHLDYDECITLSDIREKYPKYCGKTLVEIERKILSTLQYELYWLMV